jgi:hypothetical protein|tara:strand:- start:759 stop:1004 length:246 start_codon:yes stop_codon:yes gene_type:complete
MLIQPIPGKIPESGRNRFIQKNRGVGRCLEMDTRTGRIWTRTSASSEDRDASSACVRALKEAGAPIELALLIFTCINATKE